MIPERIDPLFRTTTPIGYKDGTHGGTGFYFNYGNDTYLITNSHVVDPEKGERNEIFIWKRELSNLHNAERCTLEVNGSVHPKGEDISAIPVSEKYTELGEHEDIESPTGHLAFSSDHFPPENLMIFGRTILVGYPMEFYDRESAFPTKQELTVATPYGVGFQNQPCFLTYGRTYGGTSGGPVTLFMNTGWWYVSGTEIDIDKRRCLLGVHFEGYVPPSNEPMEELKQRSENCQQNMAINQDDFNKSLYPKTILETLKSI